MAINETSCGIGGLSRPSSLPEETQRDELAEHLAEVAGAPLNAASDHHVQLLRNGRRVGLNFETPR